MESTPASAQPTPPSSKKFIPLIIGAVLIVILLVVGITMMRGSSQQKPAETNNTQSTASPTPAKKTPPSAFPQVSVSNWIVPSTITVQAPQSARLYQFRQNLTESDFRQYATNFFTVDTVDENTNRVVAYTTQTGASMLYMQKPAGSFLFTSDKGVNLPASGSAQPAQVTQFTQKVLNDPSLKLYGDYAKPNEAETRYYEFHRDWSVIGLPILNLFGLFNTTESAPLKSLSLTGSAPGANDFNTVTVGVKNGKIASFASNIRPFALAGGSSPVISYEQAVTKLKAGAYTYIYTSPQGSGQVDHDKMYPQNKATLTTATVADATIAYLEEMPNKVQTQMIPYYIFKGTGDLKSGYKVNFLAAVPAVTTGVLGTSTTNPSLMAQNNQQEIPVGNKQSQQQGTLKFSEQGGVMKGATKYEEGLPTLQCDPPPDPSQLTDVQQDASGIVFGRAPRKGDGDIEWYVVPEASWDVTKLQEAATIVWNAATNAAVEADDEKLRRIKKIVSDFEEQSAGCPVRITGSSPSVFIYSDFSRSASVNPGAVLTYSEPAVSNGGWNTIVSGNNIAVGGSTYDHLYYEYQKVSFTRPQAGWVTPRGGLAQLSNHLAHALGLTRAEASRLTFELNHAAFDVQEKNLFVGFISQREINSKLPLTIQTSEPLKMNRIHFYVGEARDQSVAPPSISAVERSSFYLLEIGASAE